MDNTLMTLPTIRYSRKMREWVVADIDVQHGHQVIYDSLPTSLSLLTWNIDFVAANQWKRVTAVLDYLQYDVFQTHLHGSPQPCVVMLQEVRADTFDTILQHPWVRRYFTVFPDSPKRWPHGARYGLVTLLGRGVRITQARSLWFGNTGMARGALLVDVLVAGRALAAQVLRIANTHLESLPAGAPRRAGQMRAIAPLVHDAGVAGGLVCGDMNALVPADDALVAQCGLNDAWDCREDARAYGATWGHQPAHARFAPGRLDKILFVGRGAYRVQGTRKIGEGVTLATEDGAYLSDHCGLMCEVTVAAGGSSPIHVHY
ncbi:hypothetical protein FA95DRAFT_970856 [Auriscalpium vulgare]|uniref:Uncharacterized protein n=1 Tax=Auriscalpium vulgare TaxID=40419 RepID=A0ACB8R743_9AGAM|nr:hypothetical protein FA95DRAFT_970856 [Auriscalpium vulgare]